MERTYKIAIIDDETEILNMLSRFLTKNGKFSVTTFSNPVHGVSAVERDDFDLVLLDIMMPQMNGLEALEKIMKSKEDQKVVIMTAYSTLDRVLKSHKVGATNYVMKPFDSLQALETKITEVLKS
ncbi:MAG: response regulator [Candidatus Marinarcus sp.]|uniref:response regulator n=1 Tax=Candidatus Marinarcus sp. TaxID=3100987 RepID=UPI003B00200B